MPFVEFFNLFNRNNPGANYVTNVAALPVPVNSLPECDAICLNAACTIPADHQRESIARAGRRAGRFLWAGDDGGDSVCGAGGGAVGVLRVGTAGVPAGIGVV